MIFHSDKTKQIILDAKFGLDQTVQFESVQSHECVESSKRLVIKMWDLPGGQMTDLTMKNMFKI